MCNVLPQLFERKELYIDFLTISDDLSVEVLDFCILDHALNLSDHSAIVLHFRDSWFTKNQSYLKTVGPPLLPKKTVQKR